MIGTSLLTTREASITRIYPAQVVKMSVMVPSVTDIVKCNIAQGGVKNDFLLIEEACDSLVNHTNVKVVPEPNSVGSYHQ